MFGRAEFALRSEILDQFGACEPEIWASPCRHEMMAIGSCELSSLEEEEAERCCNNKVNK